MNTITLHGKIVKNAQKVLIKEDGEEFPLITFIVVDFGFPYMKSEPMSIEVHFMKEPAMHIFDFLKKGKEVIVNGSLRSKNYITRNNEEKRKYFISANSVVITGIKNKEEV